MKINRSTTLIGVAKTLAELKQHVSDAGQQHVTVLLCLDDLAEQEYHQALESLLSYSGGRWIGWLNANPRTSEEMAIVHHAIGEGCQVMLDYSLVEKQPELWNTIAAENKALQINIQDVNPETLRYTTLLIDEFDAFQYHIVGNDLSAAEGLKLLRWMQELNRSDVLAYDRAITGRWTQVLAPFLRAPSAIGAIAQTTSDGLLSVSTLEEDYGVTEHHTIETVYGIVGAQVNASLSPRIHNHVYRKMEIPALFLPFAVLDFETFWFEVMQSPHWAAMGIQLVGFTVMAPFKTTAFRLATAICHPLVKIVRSTNLVVFQEGEWIASTTDSTGVIRILNNRGVSAYGTKVAVVGRGGTGRAIATALRCSGAEVTLVNRTPDKGREAARALGVKFQTLEHFIPSQFQVIVHATPVGKKDDLIAFDVDVASTDTLIIDMVYKVGDTALIRRAHSLGLATATGHEILTIQVWNQFKGMTGIEVPIETIEEAITTTGQLAITS